MPSSWQRGGRRLRCEVLEQRYALDASMLRITELVASNDDGLTDYDGDASDWMEVFNSGSDAVDLTGLHLTDSAANLTKYTFPAGTSLAGGGYLVVFASNKNTVKPNGELHTNFALSAGGEYLALTAANGVTVLDQYTPSFPPQVEDVSFGRAMTPAGPTTMIVAAGAASKTWIPTSNVYDATWKGATFNDSAFTIIGHTGIGYEQSPGDAVNFTAAIATAVPTGTKSAYTRIPFQLTSLGQLSSLTLRMKYDDGFVAYLNGVKIAEANAPETVQWNSAAAAGHADNLALVFQSFDVSAAIPTLRLGQNVLAVHGLNQSNSTDMLIVPELVAGGASIIVPEDLGYYDVPTPGYANPSTNVAGFAASVSFSVPHGIYSTPQSVTLSSATPGATIVYTTNGSTPAVNASLGVTNGILYTGPISVANTMTLRAAAFKLDYRPAFVSASTYLFLGDVINQSPTGQTPIGWAPNGLNGQEMDYGIDPNIVALYGSQAVMDSLAALPSISITTDLPNLFDANMGIYVNAANRGQDWERSASVEMFNADGSEGFSTNAGLRIRGGYSRGDFNPKHAFRLYFRGEYGDSKLDYPLFGAEGVDEYDVLDLRTSQNYSWSSEGNVQESFVREVFSRDLQRDLGDPYTRSRYYHLYLDGVYWGLYQTQERAEEFFGESYLGGDESDYDVVKHGLSDVGGTELSAGNDVAWRQLFAYGEAIAADPVANANVYWTMQGLNPDGTRDPALPVLLDAKNLIDFMTVIIYTGGYDSGISLFLGDNYANNWFGMYNRTAADQGFKFFVHDNEHSMGAAGSLHGSGTIDRTGPFNNGNQSNYAQFNPQYLHQDLLASPEYRQLFIDATQKYFFNGGPLTLDNNLARLTARVNEVAPAVMAEASRWGDAQIEPPRNVATWQAEIDWLTNVYLRGRTNHVLFQLRGDGLFTTFAAPVFSQHGGSVASNFALAISGTDGDIYYTLDGVTDPRQIGGAVNPSAAVQLYTGAFTLSGTTTVKARLRTAAGQWSGLVEATFTVVAQPGDFNGDQFVSGGDFLAWQRQFGQTAAPPGYGADGNGNGTVDAADLLIWRSNFGAPGLAAANLSSAIAADAQSLALVIDAVPVDASLVDTVLRDEPLAIRASFVSRGFGKSLADCMSTAERGDSTSWRSRRMPRTAYCRAEDVRLRDRAFSDFS